MKNADVFGDDERLLSREQRANAVPRTVICRDYPYFKSLKVGQYRKRSWLDDEVLDLYFKEHRN